MRVLMVEDDETIREAVSIGLQRDGFEVSSACDGPQGLAAFYRDRPDLVLLDLMLPGLDGISVCRAIRSTNVTPIVMLTARSDAEDIVAGLEAGADDYVVKPFDPRILAARLRAVLRRTGREPEPQEGIELGSLSIDVAGARVLREGRPVSLTATEYRLLVDLASHAGIVRSRDELLGSVWDYSWSGDTRLVDVHVQRLRAKVGREAIETVRGLGYRAPRA